jgi:predicted ArsR family transcriptional regulator
LTEIRLTAYNEQRLAELIKALPPAPQAWVEAAQMLPLARARLDDIVARAEADLAFRDALVANLEEALRLEGYEPETIPLDELRRRLES